MEACVDRIERDPGLMTCTCDAGHIAFEEARLNVEAHKLPNSVKCGVGVRVDVSNEQLGIKAAATCTSVTYNEDRSGLIYNFELEEIV